MSALRKPTIEDRIRRYEGLVRSTAAILERNPKVEEDFDDLCSMLRIKVWQGLESYDGQHASRMTEERYVFMCVANLKKDIGRRRRTDTRGREVSFEDLVLGWDDGGDPFDHRALHVDPETVFQEIEADGAFLPSTLNDRERHVICYLYAGYNQTEITKLLDLTKREMETAIGAVRVKMADWRPVAPTADLSIEESVADGERALV